MLKRLSEYFSELYPPAHSLGVAAAALAFLGGLIRLHRQDWNSLLAPPLVVGIFSLCLFVLLTQILNEFKKTPFQNDDCLPRNELKLLVLMIIGLLIFLNGAFPLMMLGTLFILPYSALVCRLRKKAWKTPSFRHPTTVLYLFYLFLCFLQI